MPLSDKESNWLAGLLGAGLATFIGVTIYNGSQTISQYMSEITLGLIKTDIDGINNPGNIETSSIPWQGKITPAGNTMEQFQNMWQGYRAFIDTLRSHYNRYGQNTLNLFFAGNSNGPGYAPGSVAGNNPANEAAAAAKAAGISADDDLGPYLNNPSVLQNIVAGTAQFEQGNTFTPNQADIQMAMADLGITGTTA